MKLLMLFIFSFILNNSFGQESKIQCIQTDAAGNVTINWSQALNTSSSFASYELKSIENGSINTINSISTTSSTFSPSGLINNYFIQINYSSEPTAYSDTFSNIYLSLNNPSNGTAILQWNNPTPKMMNRYYQILREYPAGNWTVIDSVAYGTSYYIDTIDICQSFLNYQIVLPIDGCDFSSNQVGDNFTDITSPDIPTFTAVSFDTITGNVSINWNMNHQPDTYGYIIYQIDENGFSSELDTVFGRTTTNYSYPPLSTVGSLSYTIAAFDSCYVGGSTTIFQTSAKGSINGSCYLSSNVTICEKKIALSWTAHEGLDVESYNIFVKDTNNLWRLIDTSIYRQYQFYGQPKANYTFAIEAVLTNGFRAFSNLKPVYISTPTEPNYNYLEVASILNNQVVLNHYYEMTNGVKELSFRRLNKKGIYEEFDRQVASSPTITVMDQEVDVDLNNYSYQVVVIDSCGNEGTISNIATTIFLKSYTDQNKMIHFLEWTPYQAFEGSILSYQIYKGNDGVFNSIPYAEVPPSQLYFEDEILSLNYSGESCYYIEAIESKNIYGKAQRSSSNIICPIINPIIYIPNAFTPNGDTKNAIFLPVVSLIQIDSYSLQIFNRWEQVIFESDNFRDGWDGEIKNSNQDAPQGVYLYQLKVNDGSGVQHVRRGMLNLIR